MRLARVTPIAALLLALVACSSKNSTTTTGSGGAPGASTSSTGGSGGSGGAVASSTTGSGGIPSIDCTSAAQNPILGSCLVTLFSCFQPTGSCSAQVSQTNNTTENDDVWTDGSAIDLTTHIDTMTAEGTVLSAGGAPCLTFTRSGDVDITTVIKTADGSSTVTMVVHSDTSIDITCPDMSKLSLTPSQHSAFEACFLPDVYSSQCD